MHACKCESQEQLFLLHKTLGLRLSSKPKCLQYIHICVYTVYSKPTPLAMLQLTQSGRSPESNVNINTNHPPIIGEPQMMTTIPLIRGHLKGMVTSMFNDVWSNGETEVDIVQVEERQRSSIMNINLTLHHDPLSTSNVQV